jgi:Reverse transcriptase (RNA-dependent DNA polymerase)
MGLPREVALRVAVKALNDCVGPNGLNPALSVFGTLPQLPILQGRISPDDGQSARDKALNSPMSEYRKYVAEMRIRESLRSVESESMTMCYRPGKEVLVYREDKKLWTGTFLVVLHEGKIVTVQEATSGENTKTQLFSIASVKPYRKDVTVLCSSFDSSTNQISDAHTQNAITDDHLRQAPSQDRFMITEVLAQNDPIKLSEGFIEAKLSELEGLRKNGTWEVIWTHEMPSNSNVMYGRFVLTIKEKGTSNEVLKARFVAQGFNDKDKQTLVHCALLARKSSTRTMVSFSATHGWDIQSHDVTKAHVQGEIIQREIYMVPPKKLKLETNKMLKIVEHYLG